MPDPTVAADVDETRRLLYGALAAHRTKRWELVGTLVNALVHHSGIESDPVALVDKLVDLVEEGSPDAAQWARDTTERLSAAAQDPTP